MLLTRLPWFETGRERRPSGVEPKRGPGVRALGARRCRRAVRAHWIGWVGGRSPVLMRAYRMGPVCPSRPGCEEVRSSHRLWPCRGAANQGLRLRLSKIGRRMTTKNPPNSSIIWVVSTAATFQIEMSLSRRGDWMILPRCSAVTSRPRICHYMNAGSIKGEAVFAFVLSSALSKDVRRFCLRAAGSSQCQALACFSRTRLYRFMA
jgi:hypothetical protein